LVSAGAAWDLFDRLASRSKQFARNDKPKRFRGPHIDGERERGRLLHRRDNADDQGNYSRVLLSAEWGSADRLQSSNLGALMSAVGHWLPRRALLGMSVLPRRVQPVDATLYLSGKKMELGR
jgi:hypothetical protein